MPIKGPNQSMKKRIRVFTGIFSVAGFLAVFLQLISLQIVQYDFYQEKALTTQTRNTLVKPTRGTIYDCNMKELAVSAGTEQVTVDPRNAISEDKIKAGISKQEQQETLAQVLSEQLELDYDQVLKQVQKDTSYVVIKQGVEKDTADALVEVLSEKGCIGVNFTPDTKRYYPYGNFAAQVLGFLNADGDGAQGIELQYNDVLSGKNGRVVKATNGRGGEMPFKYEQYIPAENGDSVVLTVDEAMQHFLEKNLEIALEDNPQARGGVSGIVMNVKTGEILAMANKPDFDLNEPRTIMADSLLSELRSKITNALAEEGLTAEISDTYLQEGGTVNLTEADKESEEKVDIIGNTRMQELNKMWRNKTIMDSYEPGSTFKLLNVATAYELGLVNAASTFYCSGSKMVEGWNKPIKCWKTAGHGSEDLTHALMNSCNVAMMEIAAKTGTDRFYEYVEAFGLLEKTGIDLPGEAQSIFHPQDSFTNVDLAVASFGQRFQVTPIQMISMVSAIVDDGKLKTPHMVKEIVDSEGNVTETFGTEVLRQVISESTSDYMCAAMEQVVANGTGQNAYVAGYRVGGKTATSQILQQKGDTEDRYTASFIGVAPMDDPEVIVLVSVSDLPQSATHGGGAVAAPVVARVLSDVLPYMGIEPQYDDSESDRKEVTMPNVVGKTAQEAATILKEAGIAYRTEGSAETVTDQVPSSGVKIPISAQTIVYLGGTKSAQQVTVPSVLGMSPAEAQSALEARGLYMKRTGIASKNDNYLTNTAKQSPVAGTKVNVGTVVSVEFSNSTNIGD